MNIYFWEVGNKNSLLAKLTMRIIYKNNDCKVYHSVSKLSAYSF